jgi:hypothetical protein
MLSSSQLWIDGATERVRLQLRLGCKKDPPCLISRLCLFNSLLCLINDLLAANGRRQWRRWWTAPLPFYKPNIKPEWLGSYFMQSGAIAFSKIGTELLISWPSNQTLPKCALVDQSHLIIMELCPLFLTWAFIRGPSIIFKVGWNYCYQISWMDHICPSLLQTHISFTLDLAKLQGMPSSTKSRKSGRTKIIQISPNESKAEPGPCHLI